MKKSKIAKAVALVITGTTLYAGAISQASASATTMYNLTTKEGQDFSGNTSPCAPCNGGAGTDGWVWGFNSAESLGFPPQGSTNSVAPWVGTVNANITPNHTTPFGYNGAGVLHWALHMTSYDAAEISSQDSVNRYGVGADIDIAQGAWSDAKLGGSAGWRHDLDYGLFKSDVGGKVTLNATAINGSSPTKTPNIGFTIFKGMNSSTEGYNHHGPWNADNNTQIGAPNAASVPAKPGDGFNLPASAIVAYSIGGVAPSNLNTISFNADPNQVYTIVLGGYKNGDWGKTPDGYKLLVTASAVPVPGAVWLFGSAMAGLIGFGRRRKSSAA